MFTFNGKRQVIRPTEPFAPFTDGILAIAATILVLQLEVPEHLGGGELRHALFEQWPTFLAVCIGYLWLAASWINTRRLRHMLRGMDHWATVLYLLMIFTIALIPFTMLALARTIEQPDFAVGVQVLAALSFCNGALVTSLLAYCAWRGLGNVHMSPSEWRSVVIPNYVLTGVDLLAIPLASVLSIVVLVYITADWLYALLPLFTDHVDRPAAGATLLEPVEDD